MFGPDINLPGIQTLSLGLETYIQELGLSKIVVGHDFRSYSSSIKNDPILDLISAGCEVHDITVNGVHVYLENGSRVLVRASFNQLEIVVVVENTSSEDHMRAIPPRSEARLGDRLGKYNQEM